MLVVVAGGGKELADRLQVPLLGQIPLLSALREGGDDGRPVMVTEPESEASTAFAAIAATVDTELAPTRRHHPELKLL